MIESQLYYIIHQSRQKAMRRRDHGARIMSQTGVLNKRSIGHLHLIGMLKGQPHQKYIIIGMVLSPGH